MINFKIKLFIIFFLMTLFCVPNIVRADSLDAKVMIKPPELFVPLQKRVGNLKIKTKFENGKMVYALSTEDGDGMAEIDNEIKQYQKSFSFKIYDHKIYLDEDNYIVDYSDVVKMEDYKNWKKSLFKFSLLSPDDIASDYNLVPGVSYAILNFNTSFGEKALPVYANFSVEKRKLYLNDDNQTYNVDINPVSFYEKLFNQAEKDSVSEFYLQVKDFQPVYNIRIKEKSKFFWLFPREKVNEYVVNAKTSKIKQMYKPWYESNGELLNKWDNNK